MSGQDDFHKELDQHHENFEDELGHAKTVRDQERANGAKMVGSTDSHARIRAVSGAEAASSFVDMTGGVPPTQERTFVLTDLLFFESGAKEPIPGRLDDNSTFLQSTTRYVNCLPKITNALEGEDWNVTITARYTDENGTLIGAPEHSFPVQADWPNFGTQLGYGWPDPGHWPVGYYNVEVLLNGHKLGDRHFLINGE